jgi:7-keto-8-aminopelargonate synthetase-like enzyme
MSKPVGGRGHKAPYQTMTIRIPIDVKEQVEEIVERFRDNNLESTQTDNSDNNIISQITTIIERYKLAAKSSRDWTKCNQLIQELETEIARHE